MHHIHYGEIGISSLWHHQNVPENWLERILFKRSLVLVCVADTAAISEKTIRKLVHCNHVRQCKFPLTLHDDEFFQTTQWIRLLKGFLENIFLRPEIVCRIKYETLLQLPIVHVWYISYILWGFLKKNWGEKHWRRMSRARKVRP